MVLGQAEHVIDRVPFAPAHQLFAGKSRIGAQQDAHARPAGADLAGDARHLLHRPGAAVDVPTVRKSAYTLLRRLA
jgi:hypothetical protein